ncbi:MAG: hypothetical protein JXB33_09730 [Clostridia bacterium]|nr:hypothetical protein [Clostridia bacterium]
MKTGRLAMIMVVMFISVSATAFADDASEPGERTGGIFSLRHDGRNNYFETVGIPGETGCITFTLENDAALETENHLLVYDSVTAVNGGNEIMTPGNFTNTETAGWFGSICESIMLGSGESIERTLPFTVPLNAEPGIYSAILALYCEQDGTSLKGGPESPEMEIKINSSYTNTLAIIIRVGTEYERSIIPGGEARLVFDAGSGRSFISIPLQNTGNTYEFPVITAVVSDDEGNILLEKSLKMDIFYRMTNAYAMIETTGGIKSAGGYTVAVSGEYGPDGGRRTFQKDFRVAAGEEIEAVDEPDGIVIPESGKTMEPGGPVWLFLGLLAGLAAAAAAYLMGARKRSGGR